MFKRLLLSALLVPCIVSAETITLNVGGMTCGSCSKAIKESFEALSEVKSAQADHTIHKVTIETKEGKSLSDGQIQKVIVEEGYSVDGITRS